MPIVTSLNVLHSSMARNFAKMGSILKRTLQSVSISVVVFNFLSLGAYPVAVVGFGVFEGADWATYRCWFC